MLRPGRATSTAPPRTRRRVLALIRSTVGVDCLATQTELKPDASELPPGPTLMRPRGPPPSPVSASTQRDRAVLEAHRPDVAGGDRQRVGAREDAGLRRVGDRRAQPPAPVHGLAPSARRRSLAAAEQRQRERDRDERDGRRPPGRARGRRPAGRRTPRAADAGGRRRRRRAACGRRQARLAVGVERRRHRRGRALQRRWPRCRRSPAPRARAPTLRSGTAVALRPAARSAARPRSPADR